MVAEKKIAIDERGYYGEFGGAYVPEMLHANVKELQDCYLDVLADPVFQKEFRELLKNYVGRATPLYFAKRLSQKYSTNIYLKREDLCHTGAHKVKLSISFDELPKHSHKMLIHS